MTESARVVVSTDVLGRWPVSQHDALFELQQRLLQHASQQANGDSSGQDLLLDF